MTYYEILGLERDASRDEIEQAYRALARKVHPDLNAGDAARAEVRMKELNDIRETLSDPLLRSAYDARLRREQDERAAWWRAAESGPAGEYVRVVDDRARTDGGGAAFRAPSGEGRRRGRGVGAALLVAGVIAAAGAGGVIWGWSRGAPLPQALPPPAEPAAAAPPPKPRAPAHATKSIASRPSPRGVVKIGSTAAEVMRMLGPPDRTEPGSRPGNVVYVYGQLRLELRNGVVVGGGV